MRVTRKYFHTMLTREMCNNKRNNRKRGNVCEGVRMHFRYCAHHPRKYINNDNDDIRADHLTLDSILCAQRAG